MSMNEKKSPERTDYWVPFILYFLICGVLLVIFKNDALVIANYVAAAGLLVLSVTRIVHYFREKPEESAKHSFLTIGLIEACVAALLAFNPNALSDLLIVLFGLGMIMAGFEKLQVAIDMLRIGSEKWWVLLIGAGISFVTGALTIARPSFMNQGFYLVVGIFMIVEAAQDFFYFLVIEGKLPIFKAEPVTAPAQAPAAAEESAKEEVPVTAPDYKSTAPVLFGQEPKKETEEKQQ